jgi:hypothetical protein
MEQLICRYCDSLRKNSNSLRNHERLCKHNPNKQEIKSNLIEYNRKRQAGEIEVVHTNQFTKAKALGLPVPEVSSVTRAKLSVAGKKRIWTEEDRARQSESMQRAVQEHPQSYSASNVCGRTSLIEYRGSTLNGKWELEVAKWLDSCNILWTNKIEKEIYYQWQNKQHRYFPDFYLPDRDLYIEVKGYERERDRCKWAVVPNLVVLKSKEIQLINKGLYRL